MKEKFTKKDVANNNLVFKCNDKKIIVLVDKGGCYEVHQEGFCVNGITKKTKNFEDVKKHVAKKVVYYNLKRV